MERFVKKSMVIFPSTGSTSAKEGKANDNQEALRFSLRLDMAAVPSRQILSKSFSSDPEGPRVLKNQVSWADKEPCSPTSTTSTFRSSWFERLRLVIQADHGPKHHTRLPMPFILKIMQVLFSVAIAGLYSEGIKELHTSITTMMFPYLVACNYLIVTPIILLSYIISRRMPEILVRIFNMLAVILFITAGAICMQGWHFHAIRYKDRVIESNLLESENEDEDAGYNLAPEIENPRLSLEESYKCGIMLFIAGLCCFLNSTMYAVDITWSLYTTLSRA